MQLAERQAAPLCVPPPAGAGGPQRGARGLDDSSCSVDNSSHDLLPASSSPLSSPAAPSHSLFDRLFGTFTIDIDLVSPLELEGTKKSGREGGIFSTTSIENQMGRFGFLGLGDYRAALINGLCSLQELDDCFEKARGYVFTRFSSDVILLNPRSDFMFAWQIVNLLFTLLCVFYVPIEVAFATESLSVTNKRLGALLELFFMMDIFVNLSLPIQNKSNQCLIYSRSAIWHRYSRSWLFVDVISCLPLDVVEILMGMLTGQDVTVVPNGVAILRLARIFKISKVTRLIRANMIIVYVQDFLHLSSQAVDLFKLFCLVLLTIHFMGCGLFVVSNLENFYTNWEVENNLAGEGLLIRYGTGIYWAGMTATTIGYGDIVLVTPLERLYCTLCMVIGASVYALVTSRLVGMLLLSRSSGGSSRHSDINGVNTVVDCDETLRHLEIPLIFRSILTDYLMMKAKNDAFHRDVQSLLEKLSPQLRTLTAGMIHGCWLEQVSFITGGKTEHKCRINVISPRSKAEVVGAFAAEISSHLSCLTFAPGEYIPTCYMNINFNSSRCCDGEKVGNFLSFNILQSDDILVHCINGRTGRCHLLRRNDSFGAEQILLDSCWQYYDFSYRNSSMGYCCIHSIAKPHLVCCLQKFPFIHKNFLRHRIKLLFQLRIRKCLLARCASGYVFTKQKSMDTSELDI